MLRDPLAVKKFLRPSFGVKNICKTRKIWNHLTYQPLLASHACECARVCESESVCGTTLWWSVVEVSAKKHITKPRIYLSHISHISLANKISLALRKAHLNG